MRLICSVRKAAGYPFVWGQMDDVCRRYRGCYGRRMLLVVVDGCGVVYGFFCWKRTIGARVRFGCSSRGAGSFRLGHEERAPWRGTASSGHPVGLCRRGSVVNSRGHSDMVGFDDRFKEYDGQDVAIRRWSSVAICFGHARCVCLCV
ncbi:hypothetical protein KCP69_25935 [Salmonella enterica subsp. enterica]|nr:hypothetical protein KCP69_25935 [Salmonella enterica subsp. enterica]